MQNKIILILVSLILAACSDKTSFNTAIEAARAKGIDYLPKIKNSLPHFIETTLTPTWDEDSNIVKMPKFSLTNQNGETVTEEILKDKNTVVAFLFTSCAGFCPMLARKLKSMDEAVSKDMDLQYLLISVDPETDTPARLTEFAKNHKLKDSNKWNLLTGDKDFIYKLIRNTFASEVKKLDSISMRKFAHTEHFYFIDRKSNLRSILNGGDVRLNDQAKDIASKDW